MKNYPLLKVNNKNRFYHWRNNYVIPLLNQVKDLSYYSYFIEPPYREFENIQNYSTNKIYSENDKVVYNNQVYQCIVLKPEVVQGDWNPTKWKLLDYAQITINQGSNFNFSDMPAHSYVQLTEETIVISGSDTVILPAGTWVISEARNEGNNTLIDDFNYYMYMPGGYGSFYVLTDIVFDKKIQVEEAGQQKTKYQYNLIFLYLRNAGEIYTYEPQSNFILDNNRFFFWSAGDSSVTNQLDQTGKAFHSRNLGTYVNSGFTPWCTIGTPMHFCFNSAGEEVILDETHVINLEEANTHSYTINSKHNDVRAFYVNFI